MCIYCASLCRVSVCLSRRILDSEDSFPTGAIRAPGRVFMHPDLINVQHVDGDVVNVKYLVVLRNTTVRNILLPLLFFPLCAPLLPVCTYPQDTVLSAMRRDFVPSLNQAVHIAEHTMIHIEAALRA
jgi:hypothetical protein